MAQYPDDVEIYLPRGVTVRSRQQVGEAFAGLVKPWAEGGLLGVTFTPEHVGAAGGTVNVQWRVDAPFLERPYRGSDAYVTRDGLLAAQVSTFDMQELRSLATAPVSDRDRVIDEFYGDPATPIEWASEAEKRLHFWLDDLHCPQPISPMWFDIGGWWLTCDYMYRRFGVPFGKDWVAKTINGYVMSAVVPRTADEESSLWPYYNLVMPVYADKFLDWWKQRYLPEILRNFDYLDTFPTESASMAETMILLEDALDIQERHWRLHWMLNLAQFQASITFERTLLALIGQDHKPLVGRILISDEDRNWDSVRVLWVLKEKVKTSRALRRAFDENETAGGVMNSLASTDEGQGLLKEIDAYKFEYGNKSMYAHEYLYSTWRENPTPIVEALRGYLLSDYDYEKDVRQLRENRNKAIAEMWALVPPDASEESRNQLKTALDLALKMTPLTPDHHFYMDQGTYARVRLVLIAIGRKLVASGSLDEPDDVMYLKYEELRQLAANAPSIDGRHIVRNRRNEHDAALSKRPRLWAGTITQWSMYGEPYKQVLWDWPGIYERSKDTPQQASESLKGLGASAGVYEGLARVVESPEHFDDVKKGEVLVCKMTSPSWVVLFTKIGALVTDSGGALSHPAVVSREFGIPAVVGTRTGTQRIRTAQLVRINGAAGVVEIVG
jgi:pyruvate,water dikinase